MEASSSDALASTVTQMFAQLLIVSITGGEKKNLRFMVVSVLADDSPTDFQDSYNGVVRRKALLQCLLRGR